MREEGKRMKTTDGKIRIAGALLLSFLITGLYFVLIYQKIPFLSTISTTMWRCGMLLQA